MLAIGFGPSLTIGGSPAEIGFDFAAGVLPPGARLARASSGSRFDASGVLRIEAADTPRFDHDPVTGTVRGLLIEPERTNEVAMSAAFDAAVWIGGGASVTADIAAGPDKTTTADAIGDFSDGSYRSIIQSFAQTASRTLSGFIAKDSIGRTVRFPFFRANGGVADLAFDTASGEFMTTGSAFAGTVQDCGAHWRVSVQCDTCDRISFYPAVGADSGWQYDAAATGTVTGWGFQAEQGAGATSYIPTNATPATRAADVLTLDWGRLGVADGPLAARIVFDDGSTQEDELDVADGIAAVPTTLARPRIRRIVRR